MVMTTKNIMVPVRFMFLKLVCLQNAWQTPRVKSLESPDGVLPARVRPRLNTPKLPAIAKNAYIATDGTTNGTAMPNSARWEPVLLIVVVLTILLGRFRRFVTQTTTTQLTRR